MSNEGCDNFGVGMSMYISSELERQMVNAAKDLAQRAIMACGEKYNFDGSEAIRLLGLSNVKVERQKPVAEKKPKEVVAKAAFPLPYNGEFNETCCFALRQNNGLYTQCQTSRKGENSFCKGCQVLADKNSGVPEYGTIQQRQAVGVFEYTDPKGRKPVSYTKVMKKYKVSEEQVLAEAGKFGMEINAAHFVVAEAAESKRGRPKVAAEKVSEPKGPKGRPKKSKKVLEIAGEEHEDLFAAMVANAQESSDSEDEELEMPSKKEKAELAKQKAAELAKQKEELAMQKAAEKAEKEAKLAAEKAEKEAKLAAEKAEKEAKKAAEKAEKEALLQQKKAAFEEAKAAKKAVLEAKKVKKEEPKEAKQKKSVKQEQAAPAKQEQAASKEESSEEEAESISVKEKTVNGKLYLISKAHLVYDHHEWTANGEQVVIGKWNKAEKKIEFTADSESEESEEEYEEEE
jgi:chemotaxis protein histidine kinase CheA